MRLAQAAELATVLRRPRLLRECLLKLLDATPGLVMVANSEGRPLYINAAGRRMLGLDPSESVLTLTAADYYARAARRVFENHAVPACMNAGFWRGESALLSRDGSEIPVMQVLLAHRLETPESDDDIALLACFAWDLREYRETEKVLRYQATHDPLTGLPNRTLLLDRLTQALRAAERRGSSVAVLFLDLDRFKEINDEHGHEVGDDVLRAVAKRLSACVRPEDTVARYGGDEFIVLIPDLLAANQHQTIARRIERVLSPPFHVRGQAFALGASVGVAICPEDGDDAEALLGKADAMMYRVKNRHRNGGNGSDAEPLTASAT